jgi:hypothetical protein
MAGDGILDRIDGTLGQLEILDAARPLEQEVEKPLEVVARGVGEPDLEGSREAHPRNCLRLRSSFACSAATTSAAA